MNEEALSAEDMRRIRVEWRVEAEDRIDTTASLVHRMKNHTADPVLMKELMRAFHTLKGTAAMVGFRSVADFVHQMEEYCDVFHGPGAVPLSHLSVELLEQALAHLTEVVEKTSPDRDPYVSESPVLNQLQTATVELAQEKALHFTEPELPPRPPDTIKWPVLRALDDLQSATAVCKTCPFIKSGSTSQVRNQLDRDEIKQQLAALNSLTIEPCILIVDDEPDLTQVVCDLIQTILPRARLIEADSGNKALNLINSVMGDQIDLVITDILMPDMKGFAVLHSIHQLKSRGQVFANCMVMTAQKPFERDWHECLQLGVREFLVKPFGIEDLLSSLIGPIREAMVNRLLATIVAYSERVYLGINRMEREPDQQVQIGIRCEINSFLMIMAKAQRNLQEAQMLPFA